MLKKTTRPIRSANRTENNAPRFPAANFYKIEAASSGEIKDTVMRKLLSTLISQIFRETWAVAFDWIKNIIEMS